MMSSKIFIVSLTTIGILCCFFSFSMETVSGAFAWYDMDDADVIDSCGTGLNEALTGSGYWLCEESETHVGILDLNNYYTVSKFRGRSNDRFDPLSVNLYVSNSTVSWGDAVGNANAWFDTVDWVEVDTTDKIGRYIIVEIDVTESETNQLTFGDSLDPITILGIYRELFVGPVVSHVNSIAPYHYWNDTVNITIDIDSGYADYVYLYWAYSWDNTSFPVDQSGWILEFESNDIINLTSYPFYYIFNFTQRPLGYYAFACDGFNNDSVRETPRVQPRVFVHKFIAPPQSIGIGKWKLLSLPKNEEVQNTDVHVRNATNNYTWNNAITNGIIINTLFGWDESIGGGQYAINTSFLPYDGYWLFFYYDDYDLWINTSSSNVSFNPNSTGDWLWISGFSLEGGELGLFLVLVLFFLAFSLERETKIIWKPILLFIDTPISLATGIYYIGYATFSVEWCVGLIMILLAVLLSFGGLYYATKWGK